MQTSYRVPVYRVELVRERTLNVESKKITSSAVAASIFRTMLDGTDREHFVIAMLNQAGVVIGGNPVSMGSMTASVVHPREVFTAAIRKKAAAIICCHNHPSGNVQPSAEDKAITLRLVESGKILGINILDHVIIATDGSNEYFSFADNGLLEERN